VGVNGGRQLLMDYRYVDSIIRTEGYDDELVAFVICVRIKALSSVNRYHNVAVIFCIYGG
jgi:hypothetical protein